MADVKEKVGVLTDEISTAGRPIYKTPEGEMVSEKSTTFKYKGGWINIPTIHNGYSYDEEELRIMLDNNIIKPTSTHKNLKAAEKAAKERSPTLRGFNPGGSVEGQTQKAFELNIPIPRAEEDPFEISYPSGTDRYGNVYFGGIQNKPDPFNPLQFAKSSWEDAKKKIMDAGVTETDANDPALYNGYLRAVDYFKDMGLGALDLVDAAAKAAIGTVAEIMPTEEKERRFERDIYSIPDAFMGTAGAKSLTQLDDAVDAAVAGTKQAGQKVKNIPKVFEPSEEYKQALAIEKKEQGINGYGLTTEEFSNPSTLIVPSPTKGVNIVNPTGDMKLPRINEEAMSELRSGVRAGTIEYVPIKDFLEFFPGNPLVRDTNKLLNDIETNGMTTPIQIGVGWQGHTAEIFEGNHRLDALIKGGYTHVPAMVDIMSDAGQGKLHSFFGDAIHGQATVGVRKKELPPQQKPSDVFRSFYRRLPQEVKKETFSEKANKAVSAIDTKLEDIFETVDTKYKQGALGALERKLTKEQMGKSKGKQNPVQTQKALNLGYSETGYHSTKSFSPTEEIEVFKLPDEVARDQAASQGMTLKELIKYKGLGFNNPKKAHDFLGVHVGTTKAAADRFSDLSSYKGLSKMEGARTYELKLKTNKPFLDGKKPWTEKRLNNFLVKEMDKIKDGAVFEKMQIIRRQLAEQGFTHVPYVNEVEDKNNISYAMLVDRPEGGGVNSSAVIRYKDAEFNPLEKSNRNAKFAQGGVAMKDQMEMSFAIGGVAETVDPVSGNDVPPGSLPEEVRDDIPARLSEGEYVVPADVVRYYGVKFFEDLRTQAKMGLQQMDADGRIGGEPMEPQQAELSDDDLNSIIEQAMQQEQPMMANEGGVVGRRGVGSSYGRRNLSYGTPVISAKDVVPEIETPEDIAKKLPEVVKPVQTASAGFTGTKTYYNSKGMPVSIQFINGQPQQSLEGLTEKNPFDEGPSLPSGFTSQFDFDLAVARGEINPITGLRWSGSKEKETELRGRAKTVNKNLDFNDTEKTLNWARDTIASGDKGISSIFTGGILGTAINLVVKGTNKATVRAAGQIAEDRGYTKLSNDLYNIAGGKKEKGIATGNSYADDIRKAATQITRTGKEGDKEGLKREDFAPGKLGQKKFDESMQDSAPTGYVYVPGTTTFIPSSTSLVETSTGSRISPTKMVEKTTPSSTVTSLGGYKPKDDYVIGRVGGSPTGKIIKPRLRPTKPGDGEGPPPSNVKTPGYVTNAVDRNGNRIQDGTGLAKPDTTYTRANPKPGSFQDKEDKGDDGSNDKSIVCTEMYRQTQLADWSKAMKTWDIYQKKYLTPAHEIGYHWLFKSYVKGMQKNNTLTKLGAYLAKERTQHLRHILTKGKAKDSLIGKVWCSIIHPVVYAAGKIKGEA